VHRLCDRAHQVVRVVVQRGDADGGEIGAGLLQRVAAQRRMTGGDAREEGLAGGLARSAATRASTRAFNSREAREGGEEHHRLHLRSPGDLDFNGVGRGRLSDRLLGSVHPCA
jgi:hypothetical protein